MRFLLLGAATVALSGCSWLGLGGSHHNSHTPNQGYYSYGGDGCCDEGKTLSRWNVEGAVGTEFIIGGDAFDGSGLHNPTDPNVTVAGNDIKMKDAFDRGMRYELGGSYALSPNRKVTLMGSYGKASGEAVNVGTITTDDGVNPAVTESLTGTLSDYESYGIEAGLRQYFTPQPMPLVRSVRPYVEGKVGAAKIKDINLEGAMLGANQFAGGTAAVYEGGWVPTAAGMVGIEMPVFKRATLGVESGIRYTGHPKSDRTDFAPGFELANANQDGKLVTVPVMLRGRYRF